MDASMESKGWHIAQWGVLGWLETASKELGIGLGIILFLQTIRSESLTFADVEFTISAGILALLTLFAGVVVIIRVTQREVFSLIYSITNALGHVAMFYYVIHTPDNTLAPILFALAYVIGELVKQRYLLTTGYTELGQETPQMVMFSRGLMSVYIVMGVSALL